MSSKKNSLRLHPNWRERYASQLLNQRFSSMELYQIPTIMIYESMRYCLKTGRCLWLPWNLCTTDRRLAESSRNHFRNRRFLPIHRNFRFREICGLKTGSEKRSWSLDMILHGWKKTESLFLLEILEYWTWPSTGHAGLANSPCCLVPFLIKSLGTCHTYSTGTVCEKTDLSICGRI